MAKRINYKIGDIFLIPLKGDLKGVGRVLNNNQATVLIELYKINPIKDASEFIYNDVIKDKPIVMHWCYDDALKKAEWGIINNIPVDSEIKMPYFWYQDVGDMKYYISKGTSDSFRTHRERTEIKQEDIHKYEPAGIGNEISERNRYIKKLREAGLM